VDDTGRVNVASSDADGLARALQMISDLTAVPEVGKTYLGKVVRLAEFGAFVELFPGTDGLLHISEIAEHRVKEVKDELREGDQVLVKVLGIEGNRIKLSRKALLKEQRVKLGLPEPGAVGDVQGSADEAPAAAPAPRRQQPQAERQPSSNASTITIEGGDDFEDDAPFVEGDDEPNFNRADGVPVTTPAAGGGRPAGGASAGGPAGQRRRRRSGRGRGPGGSGGPRQGGGGGNRGPQ